MMAHKQNRWLITRTDENNEVIEEYSLFNKKYTREAILKWYSIAYPNRKIINLVLQEV